MHIHPAAIGQRSINTYAAQSERAAAAQRAAEARKRLRKAAASIESADDPEASLLIGRWLDAPLNQALPDDEYSPSGRDSDFG